MQKGPTAFSPVPQGRHAHADGAEGADEDDEEPGGAPQGRPAKGRKARHPGACDPSATLEASFEALNVKKFDLAFAVDPLFHKTSALFDAGGARGEPVQVVCVCSMLCQGAPRATATLHQCLGWTGAVRPTAALVCEGCKAAERSLSKVEQRCP